MPRWPSARRPCRTPRRTRRLQLERHDRDDHGHHAVAKCLESTWVHVLTPRRSVVADHCTEFAVQSKLVHRRGAATKFDTDDRWLAPPACPDISGRQIPDGVVVDRDQCGAGRDLIAELLTDHRRDLFGGHGGRE
jgi:hypothetical protein